MTSFPAPNRVTQGDGFYVSYNDVDTDSSAYGAVTTALVLGQMERFYILNGDHRPGYRDRIPLGLTACLEYFLANIASMNHRSDTLSQE